MEYVIQLGTESDRQELLALYRSQIGREGCPWTDEYPSNETIDYDLEREALYVVKAEGRIIGSVSIEEDEDVDALPFWDPDLKPVAEFARISVSPDMQGKGIAKAMLRFLFEELKDRGFRGVHIIVNKYNPKALKLYDSFGFQNKGECRMYDQDLYGYELVLE